MKISFYLLITVSICCPITSSSNVLAEEGLSERAAEMKKTLKGQGKMRGYKQIDPAAEAESRDFYISVTDAQKRNEITGFFNGEYTNVDQIIAPMSNPNLHSAGDLSVVPGTKAYRITYLINPISKLTGEIHFAKGSARLVGQGTHAYLADLANALNAPDMDSLKFVIEGHASAEGASVTNKDLSMRRAWAIYENLIYTHKVDPKQIYALGFGEDEARVPASAPEHELAKDRRVLIYNLISLKGKAASGADPRPGNSTSSSAGDQKKSEAPGTKLSL